jgi:hypothetical protein
MTIEAAALSAMANLAHSTGMAVCVDGYVLTFSLYRHSANLSYE